ncbi:oxidoreductase [Actinorhabdospora filicis]|uniref:Oxidoreductase n=1 Tax=Actinorhabdospora filicis TaxID=1785913 RepID=A0A9W6SGE8_9ACTN|nr:CBS domain-containing protein [Actinorhabdospora filicis]GLZ76679.1 oxidoreductase [Actinorhabdospora filicis]
MTHDPVCLPADTTAVTAAQTMRDHGIGDVLVLGHGELRGIVTDRDLVVRGLASSADPRLTRIGDLATPHPARLSPDDPVDEAVRLMREKRVRRVPVCDPDGRPVGIVSLGDLAAERDPNSALAEISEAPPTT